MRFVTVMAGAASASPHGWGHGSGQRSPPMPALKCPTPRSVVSISTTRLDATQKINSGKPLRKRPRVHVRHPSQPGPKGTHCSTGFAIRAKKIEAALVEIAQPSPGFHDLVDVDRCHDDTGPLGARSACDNVAGRRNDAAFA